MQAVLIGALFLGANYYLWLGMERIPGSERYRGFTPFLLGILTVCFLVWLTPHSLVASLEEARKMGGAHHPLLGVFGVMSAKNMVVNIMILTTFLSFLLYRRGNKGARADGAAEYGVESDARDDCRRSYPADVEFRSTTCRPCPDISPVAALDTGNAGDYCGCWVGVCRPGHGGTVAALCHVGSGRRFYGVYGYYVEAIVRIGFSILQVASVLLVLRRTTLDIVIFRGAAIVGEIRWGKIPERAQYVLFLLATSFTWLMGYARSGLRTHWHIFNVMQDYSSDALPQPSVLPPG